MEKSSLYIIIMACFITIGFLSFLCYQHILLEEELFNMNLTLMNECIK